VSTADETVDAPTRSIPIPSYYTFESVSGDIRALLEACGEDPGNKDLGRRYQGLVAEIQSQPFSLRYSAEEPSLHFELDEPGITDALSYLISVEAAITDSFPEAEEIEDLELTDKVATFTRERFEIAVSLLATDAPDMLRVARLLVGHIVFGDFFPREGQTSLRNALGTVFWISPFDKLNAHHFADAIVHESTHQAIFLKDMVRGLFSVGADDLKRPEVQSLSSIRKIPRPYDMAMHAACVDAALLPLFEALGDIGEVRRRSEAVVPSLEDLDRKGHVLTDVGRSVLTSAIATVEKAEQFTRAGSSPGAG
jgi:hypothetical protein